MNFIFLKICCTRLKTGKKKIEESLSLPTNLPIRPIEWKWTCTKYKSVLEFSIKLPYTKFSFL